MKHFQSVCHIMTIGGAIAAAYFLYHTMQTRDYAVEQACGAIIALAFVAIPYCFARAVEQLAGR